MMKFVICLIVYTISTLGITYLFCKLFDFKNLSRYSLYWLYVGILVATILKYYDMKYCTMISYFIFYPILFYSISKYDFKKIIVSTLMIWLIGTILDLVSMLLVSGICHVFSIDLEKYYLTFSIILTIWAFLMFVIIGKVSILNKALTKLIRFFNDIEYSNFTLIFFCIIIFALALEIFLNLERIHVDFLLFIIISLSVFIFILLVKFKINDIENKKYLETLKENNDFYIKMDDENRIFKHNLMAKLSSIKSVSNKKAIALIDDFVIKNNRSMNYSKKIKSIPYGINGIIYQKTYPYLEDINFKLTNKIDFDIFKELKPRRYNVFVEKMVVSLDNAIEASLNSKNKVVVINFYDDEDNIYIEIKNSFAHNLDIDNLGNLNYSTKGKKRGLGLFSILRDNEAVLNVKIVNNYFVSIISARKQK